MQTPASEFSACPETAVDEPETQRQTSNSHSHSQAKGTIASGPGFIHPVCPSLSVFPVVTRVAWDVP